MRSCLRNGLVLCVLILFPSGCRLSYEILDEDSGMLDDASGGMGGDFGDGDLDGVGGNPDSGSGGNDSSAGGRSGSGSDTGVGGNESSGGNEGSGAGGDGTGGDGDSGGSGAGGDGTGGGGTGGAATQYTVTTSADEEDASASIASPGQTGLSLREAILLANAEPGQQSIVFSAPSPIALTLGVLPTITEELSVAGPMAINGAGTGSSNACLEVNASNVAIDRLEIYGCPGAPLLFAPGSGSGNSLTNCVMYGNAGVPTIHGDAPFVFFNAIFDSQGPAFSVIATDAEILANYIFEPTGAGVFFQDGADRGRALANIIIRPGAGIEFGDTADCRVWHNTVVGASGSGVNAGTSSNLDIRNNIFTQSGSYGVAATTAQLMTTPDSSGYNLYFENIAGDCSACSGLPGELNADPIYLDPVNDEYVLQPGSPGIDSGFDLGDDRNVDGPGLFNGAGPDRGFIEAD